MYEYLVMFFGLTNAPTNFNRLIDKMFCEYHSFIGVFFDDMIVYSKTLDEHKEHLAKVFEEVKIHKLYIKSKKSEF